MIAADTNVIVRLIARDDPAQTTIARELLTREPLFISLPCLLETGWVLQSVYGFDGAALKIAIGSLAQVENIGFEMEDLLDWILDSCAEGADWGDVVLLAAARHANGFATFDRRLSARIGGGSPVPVQVLA